MKSAIAVVRLLSGLLGLVAAGVGAGAAVTEPFATYDNRRFGFSVDYPSRLMQPQGESGSGDGQVFQGPRGEVLMRAFGQLRLDDIPGQCDAVRRAVDSGFEVTYHVRKPDLSVASGYVRPGRIFYSKVVRSGERCLFLELEYPVRDRERLDPLVGRIAASLRP